jgi:hypothetical protein
MKYQWIRISTVALAITVLIISNVSAQESAFGIKGGLNLTNLSVNDPETSYNTRAGYHAGIFFRERFSKVAIQPEILLSTMSTDVETNFDRSLDKYKDSFTYLSIPIMVKFYLLGGLNIHAGPQFSFLLDGDRKGKDVLGSYSYDIKDYYKSSDVSVSAGAGWDFAFGLSFDFRYNLGIKDINDVAGGEAAKSRVFQLSLGWNFLR